MLPVPPSQSFPATFIADQGLNDNFSKVFSGLRRSQAVLRQCFGLLGDEDEARQSPAGRQLGGGRVVTLQLRKPVGTLFSLQHGSMSDAGSVPAGSDLGSGAGAVFASHQGEAGSLYDFLIEARRDEQKEARGAANVEFALGDWAGDDCGISKHQTSALAEQAGPLDQRREAIFKMSDRVDAEDSIEGTVFEG